MYRLGSIYFVYFFLTLFSHTVYAQTNLLLNSNADLDMSDWRASGDATIEVINGNKVFAVRNKGSFSQDVKLAPSDDGKFAVFIGRGSSERINADGTITGLPYLYGYMLSKYNPKGGSIIAYLQGQQMRARPHHPKEWVIMYGIFEVAEKTVAITFFLNQAERKHIPQNGSAARFDDLGLYLFETEGEAQRFVESYSRQ